MLKGSHHLEITKLKQGIAKIGNNYGKGHNYIPTLKVKEKQRQFMLGKKIALGKHWKCKRGFENRSKALLGNQYAKGIIRTKEMKEKDRENTLKRLSLQKFKNTDIERTTKLELRKLRKKNKIPKFIFQFRIGKYVVDFYIPKWKLVIECNGTYWHLGFARKVRDMRKKEYLERKGYRVLVFWDKEIKAKDFRKQISKELN